MTKDIPERVCKKCGGTKWRMTSYLRANGKRIWCPGNCVTCASIKEKQQVEDLNDKYVMAGASRKFGKREDELTSEEIELQRKCIIASRLARATQKELQSKDDRLITYYNENKEKILSVISTPKASVEQYEALTAFEEAKVELSSSSEIGKLVEKLMRMEKNRNEVYSHLKAINELLT